MAAYTSLLLVIALCATAAYSLQCYTCESETSNANCLNATTCSNTTTACLTMVASGGNIAFISKGCVDLCAAFNTDSNGVNLTVTCCSSDLCNRGDSSTSTSTTTTIGRTTSIITSTTTGRTTSRTTAILSISDSAITGTSYTAIILALGSVLTILKSSVL
ncbi:prostate stem cell antigen-like [Dendropsophus ebraccatus]|uniref:prostate stem cell antigen-like n=1 Tax=Dendropsophus ebraccatus TaxID=150705 RepID=UPI0038311C69